jgi:predicted transcriptional regulator
MSQDDEVKKKQKEAMKQLRTARKEWTTNASSAVKKQRKALKAIKGHLENQPATVPEISQATGIPSDRVLWYLATLKKYGGIMEGEKDSGYFRYVLVETEVEKTTE